MNRLRTGSITASKVLRYGLLSGVCALAPAAALAHAGHETSGLLAGMVHPLTGLDHWLAMLAVGWWAAQLGGRARLVLPGAFVMALLAGVVMRPLLETSSIELAILTSVVALGAAVAFRVRLGLFTSALVVGACAVFHGLAHGAAAAGQPALDYAAGLSLTTVLTLAIGVCAGALANRRVARP